MYGSEVTDHWRTGAEQEFYILSERITRIESLLNIRERNHWLEQHYPLLKKQGDEMEELIKNHFYQLRTITDEYNRTEDECHILEKIKNPEKN